jgi:class 3 adenylate cyclase/tetratricopeptide (TPR) repeat protein
MQQAMARRAPVVFPSGRSVSLAVKVAMVAGTARRFLVGDPSIQVLDVLGGAIAERLAAAAQLVCSGEVLADAEIVRRLAGLLLVGEQRQTPAEEPFALVAGLTAAVPPAPWPAIPPGALTAAQLRPWVLPAVYERIRRGHGQFLTELRPTVALFLRFGGLDYEHDPDAPARLDAYIHWVQAVLARYEGVLLDLTLGEKGSYLYATFGAPVVHEDDARRALMAALELRTPPPELAFIQPVPIGLNLGVMRTGPSGSTARRTYAVLGDAVNVAARLMEAARPGEILVTQRVIQRVAGLFQTEPMPALKAKGKAEPLSVHRVTGAAELLPQAKRQQVGQMVGRLMERAQLDAALEQLDAGRSGVVLIEGEAGIGKSRLLGSWAEQAAGRDLQILIGASDAIERFTPYHSWRSIFTRLLQWDTLPADPAARREHVLGLLRAVGLEERAPLLNVVLPLDLHDNDLTAPMTGKVRADNTHDVLVALFQQAAARQPLLLVLEDAHWLDSASWALALAVLRQVSPLLLVLLTRPLPTPVPPEYQALLGQPDVLRLHLLPLSSEDAVALACQCLGVDALPEQVAALIRQRAEGHPFFCEELAYALRDADVIRIEAGLCQIAPGVDFTRLALPDTVEGVVTSRIDLLPAGQQLAVKVASVIGRMFTYQVLAEVHPVEADRLELADYLDHLHRLDVTPLVTLAPDPTYIFKHIITQEVAYNLLLFAQRRQLHRAVAEWYERAFAADLGSVYPLLAHHWLSASEPLQGDSATFKAIMYLEKAGEAALRSDANQEAVSHFSSLLAIVTPRSPLALSIPAFRLAQWDYQLGEAYARLGKMFEAEQHLVLALRRLGMIMPSSSLKMCLGFSIQAYRQVCHRLMSISSIFDRNIGGNVLEIKKLACNIY